jgi:hypothetical protein
MKILILNTKNYHYEIIESIIQKYDQFTKIPKSEKDIVSLQIVPEKSFFSYISSKYPAISINKSLFFEVDIIFNISIYDTDFEMIKRNKILNVIYICHEITPRMKELNNVFFACPFQNVPYIPLTILPFQEKIIKSSIPIYIIQGDFSRRNLNLIDLICNIKTDFKFKIKLLGRGISNLVPIKDKLEIYENLPFIEYHKHFTNAYCLIPCVNKLQFPRYYKDKLTSSIHYGIGYNLHFLIEEELYSLYNTPKSFVYNCKSESSLESCFIVSLKNYYKTNII